VVERLVADHRLRAVMAAQGARYSERYFAWPKIISRYCQFLERAVDH
jgi:hypothetical protein